MTGFQVLHSNREMRKELRAALAWPGGRFLPEGPKNLATVEARGSATWQRYKNERKDVLSVWGQYRTDRNG